MDHLRVIYRLIRKNGIVHPVFPAFPDDQTDNKASKKEVFYKLLRLEKPFDKEHFKEVLGYKDQDDSAFTTFMSERRKELLHGALNLNLKLSSLANQNRQKCNRLLATGSQMINLGAGTSGIHDVLKAHQIASEMDFTEEKYGALRLMESYYFMQGQHQEYEETYEALTVTRKLLEKEDKMVALYRELISELTRKTLLPGTQIEKGPDILRRAQSLKKGYSSFVLEQYFLDIQIIVLELQGRYKVSLKYCREGKDYFDKHPQQTHSDPAVYRIRELNCYLHLQQYHRGLEVAKKLPDYLKQGTQNRLVGLLHLLIFYFHGLHISRAIHAYQLIERDVQFSALSRTNWEKLLLCRGYLSWLLMNEQNRKDNTALRPVDKKLIQDYQRDRQRHDFTALKKERYGANISIKVLEALELFEQGNIQSLMTMEHKLATYNNRYLRKHEGTERAHFFFKALVMLCQNGLTEESFQKAERWVIKLRNSPNKYFSPTFLQETIAFENIWSCMKASANIKV